MMTQVGGGGENYIAYAFAIFLLIIKQMHTGCVIVTLLFTVIYCKPTGRCLRYNGCWTYEGNGVHDQCVGECQSPGGGGGD